MRMKEILQGLIDQSYDLFTGFVAKERALDLNKKINGQMQECF